MSAPHRRIFETLSIDTAILPDRTLDVWMSHKGSSDEHYTGITAEYVGKLVEEDIDEICEISHIIFHYMPILYEKLICRVALALTSSSGDSNGLRVPTAHHMILSAYELDEKCPEVLELLKGLLYMNENEILISEKNLRLFMDKAPKAFKEYYAAKDGSALIEGFAPVSYYQLSESSLRAAKLDEQVLNDAINLLRQYSTTPKNNKIKSRYDSNLFVTINNAMAKLGKIKE